MFEHPQFTHDRYVQEMARIDARNEMIRSLRERSGDGMPPRRRLTDAFRARTAPSSRTTDTRPAARASLTVCSGPAASAR